MGKYYLKKSYIVEGINLYGIRFILGFLKGGYKENGKILLKATDGIGDLLVRSSLVKKIFEKYGKENCVFLLNSSYLEVGKILGYDSIGLTRKERKNFFPRLKKMQALNSMGFSKFINLEFENDITVGNLLIPERIGMRTESENRKRANRYYTKSFPKSKSLSVIDTIREMGEEILGTEVKREEIIPDLRGIYPEGNEGISIAIGTSSREKVCSPYRMKEYVEILLEKFPNEKIYLLGNGKVHREYSRILQELVKSEEIVDLVDKTSIGEAFERIAKSKLFVGFDSGLFNFAYTVRKPTVVLFRKEVTAFAHEEPWVRILKYQELKDDIEDEIYPNREMNSIEAKDFERAVESLKIK